jgi:Ser/Thr protein kinase RdoA (MazF antagonist)
MQPDVAGWADRLDEYGIAPSLNHDDFHDGNVFLRDGQYVFFDWGTHRSRTRSRACWSR